MCGVYPIHFGVIIVFLLASGYIMPSLSDNTPITSGIANIAIVELTAKTLPFVFTVIIDSVLLIVLAQRCSLLPYILL